MLCYVSFAECDKPFYTQAFAPWVSNEFRRGSNGREVPCIIMRKSVNPKFAGHIERVHMIPGPMHLAQENSSLSTFR